MLFNLFVNFFCIFMCIHCCGLQAACHGNDCVICRSNFTFGNMIFDPDIIGSCTGTQLYDEQLAIASSDNVAWDPVVVYENFPHERDIPIHHCRFHTRMDCSRTLIRALKPYWQWVLQKRPPRGIMQDVWLNFLKNMDLRMNPYLDTCILKDTTKVKAIGDLHGDIDSLIFHLKSFKALGIINDEGIISENYRLIFLGDYTDRGLYGSCVWYVLMHLFNLNPSRVCLLRGNHETMLFAQRSFLRDWASKFTYGIYEHEQKKSLENLYQSLPCASLVGFKCSAESSLPQIYKFLLLCHGGIDENVPLAEAMRSIIDQFKTSHISQSKFYFVHSDVSKSGLLWSDFHARETEQEGSLSKPSARGCGYLSYNTAAAQGFLARNSGNAVEYIYTLYAHVCGHEHISGGINRLRDVVGLSNSSWVPLDSMITYTIGLGDVFTCASSPEGLAIANCHEDACVTICYGQDGNLHLTPFIQVRQST